MKITLLTHEELLDLCRCDPEKIVALLESVVAAHNKLNERVQEIEQHCHLDSHNSHLPPSSDKFGGVTKSSRKKSKRSSGAQEGHHGATLKMTNASRQFVRHTVSVCQECGYDLEPIAPSEVKRRQVFDIPEPRLIVTEHQCEVKHCPRCHAATAAPFPPGVTKSAQYGVNIKTMAMYLMFYHSLPAERLCEVLEHLCGSVIAEGSLFNWANDLHQKLAEYEQTIKALLLRAAFLHADETGMQCKNKRFWLHVLCTALVTYYCLHGKRGREAINSMGVLPQFNGTVIHDSFSTYFSYEGFTHALCNAHLIRELRFAHEENHQKWARKMIRLLCNIHRSVEKARERGQKSLLPGQLHHYEQRYAQLLSWAKRRNPRQEGLLHQRGRKKQTKTRNLIERLETYRSSVLAFMYDMRVAFTNNQAERDLRPAKIKEKISGTFRSDAGGEMYCRIRGYISTARKYAIGVFEAVSCAFSGCPFIPNLI